MKFASAFVTFAVAVTVRAQTQLEVAAGVLATLQADLPAIASSVPCAIACFKSVGVTLNSTAQDIINSCEPGPAATFVACVNACTNEPLDATVLSIAETSCAKVNAAAPTTAAAVATTTAATTAPQTTAAQTTAAAATTAETTAAAATTAVGTTSEAATAASTTPAASGYIAPSNLNSGAKEIFAAAVLCAALAAII
ncbi:hypothetical protein HDU83_009892 [Entophlyctis luteolus]|nr:hypothetical protein HDU83_009892 [Entophlyctis luteolus]